MRCFSSFVLTTLVLFVALAYGQCSTLVNSHTNEVVTLSTWPQEIIQVQPTTESGSLQAMTVGLNWCSTTQMNGGSSCTNPGYVQLWTSSICQYYCDSWIQAPAVALNANMITFFYQCQSSSTGKILKIEVLCDASATQLTAEPYTVQGNALATRFRWARACGDVAPSATVTVSANFGGGAAFVLIVFLGLFLYILSTVLLYYCKQGRRGKDLIPHREFWCDLPFLVKDGCVFFFRKVTTPCRGGSRNAGGYQTL
jgi:hypothetical protein